jgi:hypothetical protein
MRVDRPAEIRPAVDIAKLSRQWDLACGREERTEKSLAEIRLEKGKLLVEARKAFPAKGPKAAGWGQLLAKWHIEERTARNYMSLAGYVESVSETFSDTPTYAEAGIVKPTAKQLPGYQSSAEWERQHRDPREIETFAPRTTVSENWADDMETLAEQMIRSARSMFSAAEQLDALCRQRSAAISSAKFASIPTHLVAAQASIASTLRLFKGELS